jgi:integral membrane protein
MARGPKSSDVPLIRRTLAIYKVSSVFTGVFLLGLVVMMVTRYGFQRDIELNGADGFLALTPIDTLTGFNFSIFLLAVHGWLYVLYLACDFVLWRLLRWPFWKFLWVAMGGIIPLLSFVFERQVPREVEALIASLEIDAGTGTGTGIGAGATADSTSTETRA